MTFELFKMFHLSSSSVMQTIQYYQYNSFKVCTVQVKGNCQSCWSSFCKKSMCFSSRADKKLCMDICLSFRSSSSIRSKASRQGLETASVDLGAMAVTGIGSPTGGRDDFLMYFHFSILSMHIVAISKRLRNKLKHRNLLVIIVLKDNLR